MLSVILFISYLSLLMFKVMSARTYCKQYRPQEGKVDIREVSILQPILSGDPRLSATLESNLSPLRGATLYWLVDDNDQQAHRIVDRLISQYSHASIVKLSFPEAPEGINPKLFKLQQALSFCETQYCIVLDDDTTLPPKTLKAMLGELSHYQLVTGLPEYRQGGVFFSRLLATFVNNNASTTYLSLLPYMSPITINGMCYGFERDYLQKMGGFNPILHCLTDDLAMAEHVMSHGGKIRQIPFPQFIETSIVSVNQYVRQMHRWYVFASILFSKQKNRIKLIILAVFGLTPLLFVSMLMVAVFTMTTPTFIALMMTLAIRQFALTGRVNRPYAFILSVISEIVQNLHLLHALCNRKIRWRSRYYSVSTNSTFTPC